MSKIKLLHYWYQNLVYDMFTKQIMGVNGTLWIGDTQHKKP